MLLEREDVNPNQTVAGYSRAPLSWAAQNGHEGIVKMLLERKGVNPDQADTEYGQTPPWWAANHWHEGIVKMLLQREDVNPDPTDTIYGRTPLSWAAETGHEGIVKMLLERKDVNPNQADTKHGKTPLSWAAENGHEGIVNLLMKRNDISTSILGNMNQIPQSLALSEGNDTVRQELGTPGCATADSGGPSSLPPPAVPQEACVVEMQFTSHDPNPNTTDPNYQPTPLLAAHCEQPRLLDPPDPVSKSARECDNVDCAVADGCGPISPPPSTLPRDECIREMQFRSHDPNPDTIDPNGQPAPLPTTPDQPSTLLDSRDYVTGAADSGLPPQSPRRSQPPPIWPLGLCCRRRKIKAHLSNS